MRKLFSQQGKIALVVALLAMAATTRADSPHFTRAASALDNDGNLVVAWKEAGLGDNVSISYTMSADATATYQCLNRGGNCPAAANKQDVAGPVGATGTFSSGKNGSITASLTAEPPPTTLVCPGNQVVRLQQVSFSNIALRDDTNGISAAVSPTSVSATFFVCP